MSQLQRYFSRIKNRATANIYLTLTIAILSLYFVKTVLIDEDSSYLFDLSDGPGTSGFGITKGGTGNQGYQKDHRTGGLPPTARKIYENKDITTYEEYGIDGNQQHNEFFNKDKNKIIIILGANIEGGVNKWKGPNEWSIERSSILNKKHYAKKHGYELIIKDYTKSKKYSNDYREGWQKFDIIKHAFDQYSSGDWFWYIDLYTLVMEPQISLENLIFKKINETIERDLNYFNPNQLELDVPFTNYDEPLNLILTQDCGGFNLQSFLIKKTEWSITLLDILFDPVHYLQNIATWKNGEKNALEYYYNKFGWIRSRVGFLPTRTISSLPKGACPDFEGDERFFYNESSRDFLVNMMGCEYNRNCWDEMEFFKQLSKDLHEKWYQKWF
ncbi:glycosyltransferase family 34 protein [Wickerhamomyces anomalus NRRL Y-366-8]|uniref:Glycosyltransferase family 34 protein n=1 Tax=Wickerhamomyces anomalus (strain ATCC 58044 / CBS 1984 / NCYC 433 / NRRL Y-366-8) TaxID=683960 RepID=A0A1E3P4M9_WICAA|nr:glycosyltransferase family 34 protein [Wickerhamomyces anomalus NRRL Y-366-8]ODQ60174.1 glycosyltransferase family 34 protein [Wickerhamomyces anomalus NRRL Y-366-8]